MINFSNDISLKKIIQKSTKNFKLDVKDFVSEESFRTLVSVERKRTERSKKPFMVMLLDVSFIEDGMAKNELDNSTALNALNCILQSIYAVTRDIDIKGWHERGRTIGILFTEISANSKNKILKKVKNSLIQNIFPEYVSKIGITCTCYPIDNVTEDGKMEILYPDPSKDSAKKKFRLVAKRTIDIFGSIFGLLVFSPVFFLAPILIRLTSKGPVFFRQERVGKGGKVFKIFKFRTMTVSNDPSQHREFVEKYIKGEACGIVDEETGAVVYKIKNDSRVTKIGKFLRKTSLDEVPQFLNVLLGDMTLVGPRPPIPYEVESYDLWHKRRVYEAKPGITGYWQVYGRSSTSFDSMCRMDLQYIAHQSTLRDLKYIVKTPVVLLTAKGGY
ncbi:MAG: sugar transferase [Fibrobacter sp.]|nr:sugar transferase [Fibrobacter sp.]